MNSAKVYDLVIVGAGITGVGIALAAKEKGLKTLLIDANSQVAGGTSNNSLRIIHGGFRYLQRLDFSRAIKSIKAQKELVLSYPELITPLCCLMPLSPFGLKSKYPALVGSVIYGILQKIFGSPLANPRVRSAASLVDVIPFVENRKNTAVLIWEDAQMLDPEALVSKELAAIQGNFELLLETKIIEITKEADSFHLIDSANNKFQAKFVVNAAAIGSKSIQIKNITIDSRDIFWGKAYNLVFHDSRLLKCAFAISSSEGRQYFIVPRANNEIALGTFTAQFDQEVTNQLIMQDLEKFNSACPEFQFEFSSLTKVEEGLLPAKRKFQEDADFLSQDLIYHSAGYLQVYTSKYTTYRLLGRQVIHKLLSNNP